MGTSIQSLWVRVSLANSREMFAEALRSSDQSMGGVIGTDLRVPASFISHELVMSIIQEACKSKLHD